jgi:RNA polymerase sigma-70 factor, ECF subfamily
MKASSLNLLPSDLEGLRQFRPDAWDSVVAEVNPAILAFCTRKLAHCSDASDRADDICQKAWVQAFKKIHHFRGDHSNFRGWLWGIAKHLCESELRTEGRRALAIQHDFDSVTTTRIPDDVESSEIMFFINAALSVMDREYSTVFELSEIEYLSSAEVSEFLGISVANVNARLTRARYQIRALLEVFYYGESRQVAISRHSKSGVSGSKLQELFTLFEAASKTPVRDNR